MRDMGGAIELEGANQKHRGPAHYLKAGGVYNI
jgi:hypothetical protein